MSIMGGNNSKSDPGELRQQTHQVASYQTQSSVIQQPVKPIVSPQPNSPTTSADLMTIPKSPVSSNADIDTTGNSSSHVTEDPRDVTSNVTKEPIFQPKPSSTEKPANRKSLNAFAPIESQPHEQVETNTIPSDTVKPEPEVVTPQKSFLSPIPSHEEKQLEENVMTDLAEGTAEITQQTVTPTPPPRRSKQHTTVAGRPARTTMAITTQNSLQQQLTSLHTLLSSSNFFSEEEADDPLLAELDAMSESLPTKQGKEEDQRPAIPVVPLFDESEESIMDNIVANTN